MAHVSRKDPRRYPWPARLIFWAQKRKYGATLEPAWYWALSPMLLYGIQFLYRCLDRRGNPLRPELRALVSNRIARLNHCEFCTDLSVSALRRTLAPEKLEAVERYGSSPLFSPAERAALRFAEAVTRGDRESLGPAIGELKQRCSEREIVELAAWIAFQNLSSKFNFALDVPSQGFCRPRPPEARP